MINNRQVNIWRGDSEPPTIYHIWIESDLALKLYNGEEWVTFIDDTSLIEKINAILERVDELENFMDNATVNSYKVKDNPVLDATDLKTVSSGVFIQPNESIADSLLKLSKLLDTQIIE